MDHQNITIKNVDTEIIDILREIRLLERRQLAAILEDCVNEYWCKTYEEEEV